MGIACAAYILHLLFIQIISHLSLCLRALEHTTRSRTTALGEPAKFEVKHSAQPRCFCTQPTPALCRKWNIDIVSSWMCASWFVRYLLTWQATGDFVRNPVCGIASVSYMLFRWFRWFFGQKDCDCAHNTENMNQFWNHIAWKDSYWFASCAARPGECINMWVNGAALWKEEECYQKKGNVAGKQKNVAKSFNCIQSHDHPNQDCRFHRFI